MARALDAQDKELMAIRKIEPDGNTPALRGKIFGGMPIVVRLAARQMPWRECAGPQGTASMYPDCR